MTITSSALPLDGTEVGEDLVGKVNSNLSTRHSLDYQTISTTYTATVDDQLILADASGAGFTISLPQASTCDGLRLCIKPKSVAGGNVVIDAYLSELIDTATTKTLSSVAACWIECAGGQWWVL